jgi:hypothetical protein
MVEQYAQAMTDGVWKLNGDTIRFNGNGDLIDGQHRLNACIRSGIPFESYIVHGLEHEAFDTIDRGKPRSIADTFARQGHKHYNLLAATTRLLWLLKIGTLSSLRTGAVRPDQANKIIKKNPKLHDFVEWTVSITNRSKLIRPALFCFLAYVTSKKDEKKAKQFWASVVTAEELKRGSPAYLLHHRLVLNSSSVAKLPVTTIAALAIKAWNLHQAGKTCGSLKWAENEQFPEIAA